MMVVPIICSIIVILSIASITINSRVSFFLVSVDLEKYTREAEKVLSTSFIKLIAQASSSLFFNFSRN